MNLNFVDWINAQTLFIELVQVLSPLTLRIVPSSFFLNRRFIPPQTYSHEDFFQERSPVQLLTKLQSVQKEIEDWVGKEPFPKKESVIPPSKENPRFAKQVKELIEELVPEKGRDSPTANGRQVPCRSLIDSSANSVLKGQDCARASIQQVQEAIGKLSNSLFLQKPQEGSLLQTFKELTPKLDQIIKGVTEKKSEESSSLSRYRHAISTSERKILLKPFHRPESKVKITEEKIVTAFTKSPSKQEDIKVNPKIELRVITPSIGPILFPLKRIIQKRKKKDPKDPFNQENKES